MSIKENMSRLKQYIAELAMKADTDIRVMRNTSDRYEVSIFLKDDISFKLYGDYGSYSLIYKAFQMEKNANDLLLRAKKKGLVEYTTRQGRYIDPESDQSKKGWIFSWEVYFEDESGEMGMAPKRKGAAIEVFSALEVAIKEFITTKKPPIFHFSSELGEQSRVKLYKLLARKVSKLGGYKVVTRDMERSKYFVFHKL